MNVSTSTQLLRSLQLDDFIYGVVGAQADAGQVEQNDGFKLWNIPGMGILGVGAATAGLIALYVSNKDVFSDAAETIGDIFGDKDRDTRLDDAAELLGKKGEEFDPNAGDTPDGTPRIAKATPVPLPTPKAEPKSTPVQPQAQTPAAPAPTTDVQISRGYQVQQNMPAPSTLARPTAEINAVLQNTAKMEGVDYGTLYALAGSESSFNADANAKKSSATGLFQFTAPTWNYLTKKVYPELGYGPGDRTDPQKSAVVASRYIKSIRASLERKLGRAPTLGETYLGYFMGPTGAHNFLDALKSNPNAKGADVFPNAAKANPNLFYNKGKTDQPLTLQETMDRLEGKVTAYYQQAGQVQVAKSEIAPPITNVGTGGGPKAVKVAANIPATASPQAVPVPAPDFTAYKGGAKGEARNQEQPAQEAKGQQQSAPAQVATTEGGKTQQSGDVSYVRDKQGRLITIRSS